MVEIPVSTIRQPATVRLITTGRLKEAVLKALADDEETLAVLAELEGLTSGRLRAQQAGLVDLDPQELVVHIANANIVNAAFTYTRADGNRFNDGRRGAWYCAYTAETAVAEVAFHLTRALDDIGVYENVTDYGEMLADFIVPLHDLRAVTPAPACLDADPAVGYPAGQRLAAELRAAGSNGLLYPSVRHPGGTCLAAFYPAIVQNVRQGGIWRLIWEGRRDSRVVPI